MQLPPELQVLQTLSQPISENSNSSIIEVQLRLTEHGLRTVIKSNSVNELREKHMLERMTRSIKGPVKIRKEIQTQVLLLALGLINVRIKPKMMVGI